MNIYFIPKLNTITKETEEKTGVFYLAKTISALRQEKSITAISSAHNHLYKMAHLGLTEAEKALIVELSPVIVNLIEELAKDFIPEIYTEETSLRIVNADGLNLMEQGQIMKAKTEFLYNYPSILALLYNINPSEVLKNQILSISKRH